MTEPIDLLLHAASHARLRAALDRLGDRVRPLLLHDDGIVRRPDASVVEHPAPVATWANIDLFAGAVEPYIALCGAATSLRWLHTASAGLDFPLFGELAARGVRITTSTSTALGIAEYVLATVLDRFQRGADRRIAQTERRWDRIGFREIGRTTWLIVGFGAIGREVAVRARAFGARIVGVRRSGGSHPLADEIVTPDRLAARLSEADVVVLALPLSAETRHMVDAAFLAALRPGATTLVNVARGGHVDEAALLAGLDRGQPDHAILDVFDAEPLPPESAFWGHPRVALTAHAAAWSDGLVPRGDAQFLANLERFLAGEPLANEATRAEVAAENAAS